MIEALIALLLPPLLLERAAEEREAISLSPRLQPGDRKTELARNRF
jgi:hypothetical protein